MEVSDEARELMQVASTEFICFVTSDAIDNVLQMGRVSIKEQDVIESLENLGFSNYLFVIDSHSRVKLNRD
jgi:histone H3/H4